LLHTSERKKEILLKELKPSDIQQFYVEQLKRISGNSAIHYHTFLGAFYGLRRSEALELKWDATDNFPKLLEKHGLRQIRFHDLRHSCASLLLSNGVPMKQIQDRLGHSDFSTTANIYAHLDYNAKMASADAMVSGLSNALNIFK
jgi:integrase